jgi:alpha-1,2-glucosyltransferase
LSPRVVALWSSLGSLVVLAFLAVDWGTLVHPFLLADNRHYTFYLWRRVIGASGWSRYLAAPVYAGCAWLALLSPPLDQPVVPAIKTLMLVFCTAFVLTPAHLVEFRYFTIPWYLHVLRPGGVMYDDQRRGTTAVVVLKVITLLGYIALNAATIHVFLYKSFSWGDGSVARFMW